ncbi:HD domain-containing phosphohydrolase [Bosea sp. BK604]|uniref:HD-GYP domain-containing protein n=1 Tax=Bosea sp. BK604 TaxID=2512180 RepID=UPI00104D7B21|nr:HD domain-containing phosphohydrolase [Bosea sp. BK604]TCR68403.1 GAF domain-containing protein [Bosea sp. BK604]
MSELSDLLSVSSDLEAFPKDVPYDVPLTDLEELALDLSMARGMDEIMAVVRQSARALVGADGITFVLREGDKCYYADEDAIAPLWKGQRFPLEACISGWAMNHREVVVIEDIYADDRIPHAAYRPTFVRSLVMVPVRRDDPIGAIGAYWATQQRPPEESVTILKRIANSAAVAMTNVALFNALLAAKEEAVQAKDAIILAMASLAETRDNETGNHIRRTQHYIRALAEALRERGLHAAELDDQMIELLCKSAPLHDIGKVGIPDRILLKPGRLDTDEFTVMKTHAELGLRAIAEAERHMGGSSLFFSLAKEIAHTHHEKWDGSGYPRGLKGEAIPLSGRLMAIADVYDALVSERVYKSAIPHDQAVAIMADGRGRHFDPALTDVFIEIAPSFASIHREFADRS